LFGIGSFWVGVGDLLGLFAGAELNLAFTDLDTGSSSESSSNDASRALTFEFGVNWTGEVGRASFSGEATLEEAIFAS
jgi:hypothetical protein